MLFASVAMPGHCQTEEPGATTCQAPFNVGFRVVRIPNGPLTAIWYPSSTAETPHQYHDKFTGMAAVNGAITACGHFPLVVFSHALGGCGTQSVFFTEEVARQGYIVVAPDHADALCSAAGHGAFNGGSSTGSLLAPQKWTSATYANRRVDLQETTNWIFASEFASHINPNAIAACGHSLGGYDVLGIAGGWTNWRDSRFKAVLALSPYSLPFSLQNTLRDIHIPLMYQGAQGDLFITPFVRGPRGAYGMSNPPKYYMELKGGTHFAWTDLVCFGSSTVSTCLIAKPNARMIDSYGIAFFDEYLKGNPERMRALQGAGVAKFERNLADTAARP